MITRNKIPITILLLFIILIGIQCNKEDIPVEDQSVNCWTSITDWTDLLSDSSIEILPIPQIPLIDTNYLTWLNDKYNRIDIRSLTSENFSDLQCLTQYLENRTLVQLGESSHSTKQFSEIKIRLIKFMHEQMGFDVIAFESSFFECFYTNENIQNLTETEAIKSSLFSIWGDPMIELFSYIKETRNTAHPLILAGIDCPPSSPNFTILKRPNLLFELISKVDLPYATHIRSFDSSTIIGLSYGSFTYLTENRDFIKSEYRKLVLFINNNLDSLNQYYTSNPMFPEILEKSVLSSIAFVDQLGYIYNDNHYRSNESRDSAMAENVYFLKEKLYPHKKIIIWAHNYHVANDYYQHAFDPDIKTMGIYLKEKYKDDLYTIGLYVLKGKTKDDNWSVINIPLPVSSNSLEAILYYCEKKYLYVDLRHQNYSEGNKWMFTPILTKVTGLYNESMIIKDNYDGIVFVDSSSYPTYIN